MHPRRQRLAGIVGMALIVYGQQRFLHQILNFVGQAGKPPSQKRPQMRW
jgi:hypothetical protein